MQGYIQYLPAIGLVTILLMGVIACFALIVASLWALAQFALIATSAIIECSQTINATFVAGDALTKLLLLCIVGWLVILVGKFAVRSMMR